MENLARYIIRASFSHERMTYLRDESKVLYQSKDAKQNRTFNALEWLAAMCSHAPDRRNQRDHLKPTHPIYCISQLPTKT
jgi:hypothetical protein